MSAKNRERRELEPLRDAEALEEATTRARGARPACADLIHGDGIRITITIVAFNYIGTLRCVKTNASYARMGSIERQMRDADRYRIILVVMLDVLVYLHEHAQHRDDLLSCRRRPSRRPRS